MIQPEIPTTSICSIQGYDVVPMDATHLLLGRPWYFHTDITYGGRLIQYVVQIKDRRIVLLPLGSRPRTRERARKTQPTDPRKVRIHWGNKKSRWRLDIDPD